MSLHWLTHSLRKPLSRAGHGDPRQARRQAFSSGLSLRAEAWSTSEWAPPGPLPTCQKGTGRQVGDPRSKPLLCRPTQPGPPGTCPTSPPLRPAGPGSLTGSPTQSPVPSAPLCPHLPAGTAALPASAEVASAGSIKWAIRTLQLFRLSQHPFDIHSGSTYFLRGTV